MTEDILGLDQQIQQLEEDAKSLAKKKKELEEKKHKQFCDLIEIDVIEKLEKKYDFKGYRQNMSEFCDKFDDFLVYFDNYINTNSKESKKALKEMISSMRELTEFFKNFNRG